MKKVVVLSGAGISAESGIATFRASDGLWEGHNVMEVASPEGWNANPELVLDFYNQRRRTAHKASPNQGHLSIAALEKQFDVTVVTQNVDNLHEQAGSSNVIHLHGELFKSQSTDNSRLIYSIEGTELNVGDYCENGHQLRPHIVWFGEAVPKMEDAIIATRQADIFIVIGTSLNVYPAAGLIDFVGDNINKYIIDPNMPSVTHRPNLHLIEKNGTIGMVELCNQLLGEE